MKVNGLATELKRLIGLFGLNQAKMAAIAGVSDVTLYWTLQGKQVLGDKYIWRIASQLGIDPLPLLELAAIDRGSVSIAEKPRSVQRLLCRLAHGDSLSEHTAAKLAAILDQEPVAA